jgi:PTH1 family peptidyl-tRNA hydrolase
MSGAPALSLPVNGTKKIFCIVGLGNPGERYSGTPHNIGFAVVDELGARHGIRIAKRDGLSLSGTGKIGDADVVLIKPQTFMNISGAGVQEALKYRSLTNQNLIVVHDELDLPWQGLRIKENGSAAGHNGVKSIIAALKTDVFIRVRVGVRPDFPIRDAAEYVLAPFARAMRNDVQEVVSYTADAIECIVAEGASRAMTKFNRRARGITKEEE